MMNLGSQNFKFEDGQWISGMASYNKQTDLIQCQLVACLKNVMKSLCQPQSQEVMYQEKRYSD